MAHRFVHHPPHASTVCIFLLSALLLFVQLTCAFKKLDKPSENESTKFSTNSIGVTKMIDLNTRTIAYKDFVRKTCYIEKITTQPIWENRRLLFIHPKPLTNDELLTIAGPSISLFCFGWQVRILRLQSNNEIRRRRSTDPYFFVARKPRGQTQSQYLNFGGGEPGKAEAESSNSGSKALVYGSNGMGQAQSQSGPFNCADCYGSGDSQLQSMKPGQTFPTFSQSSDEPGATHTIHGPGYAYDATSRPAGAPDRFQQPGISQYPSSTVQGAQQPGEIYDHQRPGQQQIFDQRQPGVLGPGGQIYQQGTPGTRTDGTQFPSGLPPSQTFQTGVSPASLYKPGISGQPQSGQLPTQFPTTSPGDVQHPGQISTGPQQTSQLPISYPGQQQIGPAGTTTQQHSRPGVFQTGSPGISSHQPGVHGHSQQAGSQFPTTYQGANIQQPGDHTQQPGSRGQQPVQQLGGYGQQPGQPGTGSPGQPSVIPGLHQTIPGGSGQQVFQHPGSQQPSTTGQQTYHPAAGEQVYSSGGRRVIPVTSDQQIIRYGQPGSIGAEGVRSETGRGPQSYGQDTLHKPSGHPPQIGDVQVMGGDAGRRIISPGASGAPKDGLHTGSGYQEPHGGSFSGRVVGQYETPIGHTGDFTGSIQGNYNLHGATPGQQYQSTGQTEQQITEVGQVSPSKTSYPGTPGTSGQTLTHPSQISTRPIGSQMPALHSVTPQGQLPQTAPGGQAPGAQGIIIPSRTSPNQIFRPGAGQVPTTTTTIPGRPHDSSTLSFTPSGQIYQPGIYDSTGQIPQTQQTYGGQTPGSTSLTPSGHLYGQQPIASQSGIGTSQSPGTFVTAPSGQIYIPSKHPISSGTGTPISETKLPTGRLPSGISFPGQPDYTQGGQISSGTPGQYGQQYFPGHSPPTVPTTGQTYPGTVGSGQYPITTGSSQTYPGITGNDQTYPRTTSSGQTYPGITGSGQTYPGSTGSVQTYPGIIGSGQRYPGTTSTGQTYPVTSGSGQIHPGTTSPGQTYPGTTGSGQTYPVTSGSSQIHPGTTSPGQTYPGTSGSGQTYPVTSGSGQAYPGTTSPGQTYPATSGSGQTYPGTVSPGQTYPGNTGSSEIYSGLPGSGPPGQFQQPSGPAGTAHYPSQSHVPSGSQTSFQPQLSGGANQQYGTSSDGRGGGGQFISSTGQLGQVTQQAPGKLIYGGQETQLYGGGAPGTTGDDSNSQAQSTIQRVNNETQAMASSSGRYNGGNAQSQVSGAYSGHGSFSASAGSNDGVRGAQTQIIGNKDGVVSSSQGQGGRGQSQAQVQMAGETGDTKSSAQSSGVNHGTNTQVQSGIKGGMADAQANGPGSTSSQAQIGFSPYDATEEEGDPENPHNGGASASAASGNHAGKSQVQINGRYAFGIRYTGQAQASSANAGHTADDFNLPTMKPFEYSQTHSAQTQPDKTSQKVRQVEDGKILKLVTSTTSTLPPTIENDMQYDYDDDDYEDSEDTPQKNLVQHQPSQRYTRNNTQINIDPVEEMALPRVELKLKHGDVLHGGESIPGSSGYKIPSGFRGRIAEHNINLQQPQIVYAAGANANRHKTNLDDIGYGSGFSYQPTYSPIQYGFKSTKTHPFVSVTKSETGSRNVLTGKKTPSVYYTQSSTCGYFTNTCFYSNGKKICIPKFKSHPHGSPIVCKN